MLAAEHEAAPGAVLNVCTGVQTQLLDLVAALYELLPKAPEPLFAPSRPGEIYHSVGSSAKTKDLLVENSQKYLDPQTLARLQGLELRARLIVEGYVSGVHRSPFHGFSIEFAEHREYSPGDDLRYLDWKVFGRTDKFYLKQYEEETNLVCYLLLDTSESMRYRSESAAVSKRPARSRVARGWYARGQISQLIGCRESELFFTGGGTEAINTAIRGILAGRAEAIVTEEVAADGVVLVPKGSTMSCSARPPPRGRRAPLLRELFRRRRGTLQEGPQPCRGRLRVLRTGPREVLQR